jgi:pimeloyl-ACP methyl ester carboxylesterase
MATPSATPDLYLPLAGGLLRYRDEGRGPPVLLVHGWTLDLDMWEPQVAALRDSFRLVRFDRRGFGFSASRTVAGTDAQDALSLCDTLGLGRLACVGMSQGARVALQLCRTAPERLACVVLDGPPTALAPESADDGADVPVSEYRGLIARGELATVRRRLAGHPLMQLETHSPEARALLERMMARYAGRDLLPQLPASEDQWQPSASSTLRTPSLIVTGEHDLAARVQAADALAKTLPQAKRAIIRAARHLPNLDNPSAYNSVLRAFLERHAGSRP